MEEKTAVFPELVPSHVPPGLVRQCPFFPSSGMETTTTLLPRSLIPELLNGPSVFWAPGAYHSGPGAWILTKYADFERVYRDSEHFSSRGLAPFARLIGESWHLIPVEEDPPLHARYRLTLNPILAPSHIALLDERIRECARVLILSLKPRGRCDFVADFAFEFPVRVFLELMGLPQERMAQFLAWENSILRSAVIEQVITATKEITAYLKDACEDRRREPRNDLLSLVVRAEVDNRKLTSDEIIGFAFNLFVAGLDTVSTTMSSIFRHLAERPEHQTYLRAHPDKIPDALVELMRAYGAVTTSRLCIAETSMGAARILPGDMVLMSAAFAGNDPDEYLCPEVVDFERRPRHLSFGHGAHICIGMHLARREMRIAIEEVLAALPEFGIEPEAEITSFLGGIVGPRELPLVWAG